MFENICWCACRYTCVCEARRLLNAWVCVSVCFVSVSHVVCQWDFSENSGRIFVKFEEEFAFV